MTNPETAVSKDIPQETPLSETPTSRRNAAALLGILGAAFVSGCASRDGSADAKSEQLGTSGQALSQSDFYWFDDVSSLLTTAGSSTYMVAVVGGYSAIGDGGGGIFYWDAASTETPDAGTIFQEGTTNPGRWKRLYSGAYNVRWFGPKGTNFTTNDDTAFANAIAAMELSTTDGREGRELHIPAGKYYLTHTLHFTRPTLITGAGGAPVEYPATDLIFSPASGADFAGLWFDGPVPGTAYTSGSVVRDLAITGPATGADFDGVQMNVTVTMQNCFIRKCTRHGIRIFSVATTNVQNADMWRLDHVFVEECSVDGLFIPRNGVTIDYPYGSTATTFQDHTLGVANQFSAKSCGNYGVNDEGESANSLYMSCNVINCGTAPAPPVPGVGGTYNVLTGMLLNCYGEGGNSAGVLGPKAMAIGGTYANPNPNPTGGLVVSKTNDLNMQCNTGLQLNAQCLYDGTVWRGQDGLIVNRAALQGTITAGPSLMRLNKEDQTTPLVLIDYDGQVGLGIGPTAGAKLKVFDISSNGGVEIGGAAGSGDVIGIKMAANEAADSWKYIQVHPGSASSPYSNAMSITTNGNLLLNGLSPYTGGNVGIGLDNPTSKFEVYGDVNLGSTTGTKVGFMGATPIVRPTVTGSKGGNAALASLLTQLANLGLITDSST